MNQGNSIWIFIAFAVFAVGVVIALAILLYDVFAPMISSFSHGVSFSDSVDEIRTRIRNRRKRLHGQDEDEDDDDDSDDLDSATATLLSMLPKSSVVVDDSDEVIRANPEAYRLGIVNDDVIVNPEVRSAVQTVREKGSRVVLQLTTQTPEEFAYLDSEDQEERTKTEDSKGTVPGATVSRPNWLNVIVGRISEQFVVVLIEDVSESIRFSQVRDDFIDNVSQQLVKPGRELQQLADTLENGNLNREQIAQEARAVRKSSLYVQHMIGDLLLLIKAQEPVSPNSENRVNLMEQVRTVVSEREEDARAYGVKLNVRGDESLEVHGEDEQIRIALTKLVENALEYSPAGSSVNVVVGVSQDKRNAVIRVIDRGKGIDTAEQSRIFERFYRGSNQHDRNDDGVGLGLAIVKHVALTHHGSVNVWSRPGQGSTFSLILPLAS